MSLGMIKKLPVSLRNDFWSSVVLAIEDEVLLMQSEIEKKKILFTPSKADLTRLKELGSLVYEMDLLSLTSIQYLLENVYGIPEELSEEFLRKMIMKIPFQTKYKALLPVYQSSFNFLIYSLDYRISVYKTTALRDIFTGEIQIIRDLAPGVFSNIPKTTEYKIVDDGEGELHDSGTIVGFTKGYPAVYVQEVTNNFLGRIKSLVTLDIDDETLDGDETLFLDTTLEEVSTPTKHISFEVVAKQLFTRALPNGTFQNLLFPAELAALLYSGIYFNDKKLVEVPHIGIQLTLVVDNTGYSGVISDDLEELGCQAIANTQVLSEGISTKDQIVYMKFGIGKHIIPPYSDVPPVPPIDLQAPIYTKYLLETETYDSEDFMGAIGEYRGQAVGGTPISVSALGSPIFDKNGIPLVFGIGNNFFEEVPLPSDLIAPIKPGTLKLAFIDITEANPLSSMKKITDDGFGNLISDVCTGTVDYKTGKLNIITAFDKKLENKISFEGEELEYFIEGVEGDINPSSLRIILREDDVYFSITDDGSGVLISDYEKFDSGTVNYSSPRQITINFTEEIKVEGSVVFNSSYVADLTPTHILSLYEVFTENPVQITEAGLFVRTDSNPNIEQMVSYVTFPAVEFIHNFFHLNLGIVFEK